jgi:hypothetical protein
MSEPRITFAKLRQLLLDQGFTETVVPDSHIAFLHGDSDIDVRLPLYRPNQPVLPRHLVPVRTLLDGRGLLEAEEFDRLLQSAAVKQPAS